MTTEREKLATIHERRTGTEVCAITDRESLNEWADRWNRLAMSAPGVNPMSSFAYYSAWLDCRLRPEESWACVLAAQGDELLAVLPLLVQKRKLGALSQTMLVNPYQVAPILPTTDDGRLWSLTIQAAFETCPQAVGLELGHIRSDWVPSAFKDSGKLLMLRQPDAFGKVVDTTDNVETYMARFKSRDRREIRRRHRRLMELPDARASIVDKPEKVVALTDAFVDIEGSGWKGERGTAIKDDPAMVEFYRSFIPLLADLGACEWHLIEAEGTLVAMDLVLRGKDTMFMPKTGFREEYRNMGPGQVGHYLSILAALGDPTVRLLDFMSDGPWLDIWQVSVYDYVNVYVYPKRLRSRVVGFWPRRLQQALRG
ncbi:GNAT family N-acetyltransferase [candidate division GN15 bacterium]|nr:GNAT family N-acetyltransferase [candidate division GN15 bacterium]